MLVNIFKAKTPVSVISSPILVAVLALSVFFRDNTADTTAFFSWQADVQNQIGSLPWLNYLITIAIISLNAHQLTNLFNQHSFFARATFIPGLLYVILLAGFGEFRFGFGLIAHLFVIFSMMYLFQLRRQEPAKDIIFKAGLLAGMAWALSFSLGTFILAPWIGLLIFKPFIWREWLLAAVGLALPMTYQLSILFLADVDLSKQLNMLAFENQGVVLSEIEIAHWILLGLILLITIVKVLQIRAKSIVRFKKLMSLLFYITALTALSLAADWFVSGQLSSVVAVPLSVLIGVHFLNSRNESFVGIVVIGWFIISGINHFVQG